MENTFAKNIPILIQAEIFNINYSVLDIDRLAIIKRFPIKKFSGFN